MPSVRIEDDAFGDLRYETLAEVAGLADADHARGKMIRLWRQCTAERIYHLSETEVCAVLGPRGVDALIRSRLGEQTERGIRIRGTKGRIEWLEKLRKNGSKGGRPRKPREQTKSKPSGFPESNPLAPVLVTAPALSDPEISVSAGARETTPASPPPHDVRAMAEAFRSAVDRARAELQTELDVPFPGGSYADRKTEAEIGTVALGLVLAWIRSAPGQDPARVVRERVDHLIAIRAAVARHRKKVDWWAPGTFWRADGIAKDMEHRSPFDAVRALTERPGPRMATTPPPTLRGAAAGRAIVARLEAEAANAAKEPIQ